MINPSTRLRRAILLNDVTLVKRITSNHPELLYNPDFDDKSNTSLHLAASHGFTEIAHHLIDSGHDQHEISRNCDHETPLMLAARHGHVEAGRLLATTFPTSINMTNRSGQDAISLAAQNPSSTALIAILLTPHPVPSPTSTFTPISASPHTRDTNGNTPLHHASASGSLKALRILLAAGADPLATNSHSWTPLAYSQTVAAEVYFKNLVAEFERRRVEGLRAEEERERARVAGVRVVDDGENGENGGEMDEVEGEEVIGQALRRHWSPVERKRRPTGGSVARHEWGGGGLTRVRTRSGSGG